MVEAVRLQLCLVVTHLAAVDLKSPTKVLAALFFLSPSLDSHGKKSVQAAVRSRDAAIGAFLPLLEAGTAIVQREVRLGYLFGRI